MKKNLLLTSWILTLSALLLLTGCQSSKEMSRSTAQSLIEAHPDFKQPVTIDLQEGVGRDAYPVEIEGDNDSPEAAVKRMTELQVSTYPRLELAFYLKIARDVSTTDEQQVPVAEHAWNHAVWHVNRNYQPTEKGLSYWKEYNLPPAGNQIPIAQRRIVEITGITKVGEDQAAVEYTYSTIPNEIGKYLDPSTSEFKSLPPDLRDRLTRQNGPHPSVAVDWSQTGRERAFFRRYDDGWRIERPF